MVSDRNVSRIVAGVSNGLLRLLDVSHLVVHGAIVLKDVGTVIAKAIPRAYRFVDENALALRQPREAWWGAKGPSAGGMRPELHGAEHLRVVSMCVDGRQQLELTAQTSP